MQYTKAKFDDDAVSSIYDGVNQVTQAVATTLGPLGRNVLIDKGYETVIIHDGVKVSLSINPEDEFARAGATIIKEATQKQRDVCGDGTTVACVLTQAIAQTARKLIASGVEAMTLKKGLDTGCDKVVKKLQEMSIPVTTLEQKVQIATVSAQDATLGQLIAETIEKVGDDGIITVEESKSTDTYVDYQEGMQIDKGYAHQFMVTDPERMTAVMDDPYILITDYPLNTMADIGQYLENKVLPNTKKVLFIAPEIGVDFMQVLLNAKLQGLFLGIAVRAPGIGSMQTEMLQDICALTGAKFITKEAGIKFNDLDFSALGRAHRIVCSKVSTIISGLSGYKEDIARRIQIIRGQMEDPDLSDYDKEQNKARLAKLTNGVAVIKVGGYTDVEMKEVKERVEDAVLATQSAVKSGIVPGGEIVYLNCLNVLDTTSDGENILYQALQEPFRRLLTNAGLKPDAYTDKISGTNGINVVTGEVVDMVQAGIIDPLAVPVNAVKTAVSVAGKLSSLGAAIVLQNE